MLCDCAHFGHVSKWHFQNKLILTPPVTMQWPFSGHWHWHWHWCCFCTFFPVFFFLPMVNLKGLECFIKKHCSPWLSTFSCSSSTSTSSASLRSASEAGLLFSLLLEPAAITTIWSEKMYRADRSIWRLMRLSYF